MLYDSSLSTRTPLALNPSITGGSLNACAFFTTLTSAAFVNLKCLAVSLSSSAICPPTP